MKQSIEIMVSGTGWEEGAVPLEADSLLLKREKRPNGKREVKVERIKSLLGALNLLPHCPVAASASQGDHCQIMG